MISDSLSILKVRDFIRQSHGFLNLNDMSLISKLNQIFACLKSLDGIHEYVHGTQSCHNREADDPHDIFLLGFYVFLLKLINPVPQFRTVRASRFVFILHRYFGCLVRM
jgi:hypothetical protein